MCLGKVGNEIVWLPFATEMANPPLVAPAVIASPEYTAVSVWIPALLVVVWKMAVPPIRLSVPNAVPPSRTVTVPVGKRKPDVLAAIVTENGTPTVGLPAAASVRDELALDAPKNIEVVPASVSGTATSSLPSPLKSATATA